MVLPLIAGCCSILRDVARSVPGRLVLGGGAGYEEFLVGPPRICRRIELLRSGSRLVEEVGVVATVETRASRGISGGLLRGRGDGILRWRHMAVTTRLIATK